jgi:hypothetical protein
MSVLFRQGQTMAVNRHATLWCASRTPTQINRGVIRRSGAASDVLAGLRDNTQIEALGRADELDWRPFGFDVVPGTEYLTIARPEILRVMDLPSDIPRRKAVPRRICGRRRNGKTPVGKRGVQAP